LSSLSEPQVQAIVAEARRIEDSFGAPQDIEFAFDEQDIFYVLQSRDITSLFPIDHLVQDGKLRAYLCTSSVMLGMKEPFTLLGFDLFSHMFPTVLNVMTAQKRPLGNSFVKHEAGRIFVDMTYMMSSRFVAR
jgi:rifampicin phosphotransferase